MPIPLPPYEAPFLPVPNVTPLTYRDGYTMLRKLDYIQRYINETLVPFVNENYEELAEAFETQANALIAAVNAAIEEVLNSSVEAQDPIIAEIFQDVESLTRQVTDALYADKTSTEAALTAADGRLDTIEAAIAVIEGNIASIEGALSDLTATVNTNRLRMIRSVKEFGAIGDGVADDTAALNAALAASVPLYWGGPTDIYRVTAALIRTLTADLVWRSDGAQIKVDASATHIHRVVDITTAGFDVWVEGPLTVDANNKANSAWSFRNETATFAKITLIGLCAWNVFRADQTMTGGDGIYIRGAFTTAYIEQADIRNIVMASGAGVSGTQGVAGISVVSHGAGMAPDEVTIIAPYIFNVYSQDASYLMDQDGIRIFTEENTGSVNPFPTHFNLIGGKIINCGGRSVKVQGEFGQISGTYMARRSSAPWGNRKGGMPEIDFQTGAGIIRDVEIQYVSNTPIRVIGWTGTSQSGGKHVSGILVDGVRVTYSGSQTIDRFISATSNEQVRAVMTVQNVEIVNPSSTIQQYFATIQGTNIAHELIARILNCTAPILSTQPWLYRVGVAAPLFSNHHNVVNTAASGNAAFTTLNNAGSHTATTTGTNVRTV